MTSFLRAVVVAIVWSLAVAVYTNMRRGGKRGFGRFAAFWAGFPATWIILGIEKERDVAAFDKKDDNGRLLLWEIRQDRAKRAHTAEGEVGANDRTGGEPPPT
jgi:hypothetical protein